MLADTDTLIPMWRGVVVLRLRSTPVCRQCTSSRVSLPSMPPPQSYIDGEGR